MEKWPSRQESSEPDQCGGRPGQDLSGSWHAHVSVDVPGPMFGNGGSLKVKTRLQGALYCQAMSAGRHAPGRQWKVWSCSTLTPAENRS